MASAAPARRRSPSERRYDAWRGDRQRRIARHFAEHRATYTKFQPQDGGEDAVEELRWAKPETGIHAIVYRAVGPYLFITGDMGCAVFWRAPGLAWWAGLTDLYYFASKCEASPQGRSFRTWDAKYADANVRERLAQASAAQRHVFRDSGGWACLQDAREWADWIGRHGEDVFYDAWELLDAGDAVAFTCEAMLAGLRMAWTQLRERGEVSNA